MATTIAALAIGWPLLLHLAAMAGHPEWMPAITATIGTLLALVIACRAGRSSQRNAALGCGLLIVVVAWRMPGLLVFAPPVAINLALAVLFGRTLHAGRMPMIAQFALRERGTLEPDVARYTRALTVVWTTFFVIVAMLDLVLATAAPLLVWSTFANAVSYGLVALLFVGEYAYRHLRFPHYRHAPLRVLVRNVAAALRESRAGR
jgi:uncharacterized membrane protein